ncbi:major pollen allergen Aln g 1 isoform X2 [Selaginella moellendorffii]|uniref:major pollen allergen Aln g 1 isoform X2 n=1 Tax=Selaginella moellendorffii TaxID=88036 RepID=UPI000D1C81A4|nr:major pollen allergen Aln g 1 isoform X2 [Selaginella moellendorffii]|eukprot:XP_024518523.1 major pollen allergen Aln g 1 isoform X2 [Selaginella moellendorffii]
MGSNERQQRAAAKGDAGGLRYSRKPGGGRVGRQRKDPQLWTSAFIPAVPMVKFIKERVESVDEANYTTVTSVIDGGFIGIVFSLYRVTVSYEPSGDGSSTTITWRLEYEPLVESPSLEESKMGALGTFHAIEAYLLSHNEEYNSGVEEAQFGETTQLHA